MNPANIASPKYLLRRLRLSFLTVASLALLAFTVAHPLQTAAVTKVVTTAKDSIADRKLTTLDGQEFSLASMRGKVVVLDFFGMRCAHSRNHIKDTMTRFSEEDFDRGLQIIGVESESSTVERVRQYVKDQNITYPVIQVDEATFVQFVKSRNLSAPQTLVFGRDGKLLLHTMGHSAKNSADIRSTIQKALDKK